MSSFVLAVFAVSLLFTEGNVSIRECPQKAIQISEDGNPISFTCDGLPVNESAQWKVTSNSAVLSFVCNSHVQQSCQGNANANANVNVSRPNTTTIVLTIVKNQQDMLGNGSVICSSAGHLFTCNTTFIQLPPTPTTARTPTSVPSTSSTAGVAPSSTQGQTTTDGNEEKDDGLPIAAIAGGVAAFLVIIIIVIIIVVVVVVRRRKRQKKAHADNNVLEEHVNPMYGSGDEPETTPPSNSKPSGVALRIPTDTTNNDNNAATVEDADNAFDAGYSSMAFGEQQTVSPSSTPSPDGQSTQNTAYQAGLPTNTTTPVVVTDADLYTAVDGMDQEHATGPVQDHAGGHSTEGGPKSSSTAAPCGDVYAVVQKSGPRAQSASATTTVSPSNPGHSADGAYAFVDVSRSSAPAFSTSKAPSGDPVSDNADNTYAVVNKSSSRGKGTGPSTSPDTSNSSQQAPSGDVYAQVDKSSKRNGSTSENDDEGQSYVYAQVDKGNNFTPVQQTQAQDQKPGIKPKPALKPKPSSNA